MLRAFHAEGVLKSDADSRPGARADMSEFDAMRKMVSFVQSRCDEALSLRGIAAAGGVCRSRCCELFARHMGQSPIAYLNAYRLEKAFKLLHETRDSIADIAFASGFSNQSYFTRQFKSRFGTTPLRARRTQTPSRRKPAMKKTSEPSRPSSRCPCSSSPSTTKTGPSSA